MADASDLTDFQLAILGILWQREEATVADVHAALGPAHATTLKTVATVLGRLEQRGVVRRRMDGKQGIYSAAVSRRSVLLSRMTGILAAILDGGSGTPPAMAERQEVRPGDAARLKELLRRAEQDFRGRK